VEKKMTKNNTLEQLSQRVFGFLKARGWNPTSHDLAKSIVIEAAELLEKYQWDDSQENLKFKSDKNLEEIGEEAADVFIYLIEFCKAQGINLNEAVKDKIEKNEKKYPAEKFKGKHNHKFYMEQKLKYRENRKNK
jgi:NTP pyrophosphatase (non-canonical NTP hydrolase)